MPFAACKMSNNSEKKFAAVLPAGGLGKRMGASLPKQLLKLGEKPVYQYALETFAQMPEIQEVVLAVPTDWKSHFEEELSHFPLAKKIKIVVGGKERWQSVRNGIEALSPDIDFVLVHDVARPFLSKELILQVMETLKNQGACLVAKHAVDTVKIAKDGKVLQTIPRETVYLAQTPQAASVKIFRSLYQKIDANPLDFLPTDEASILEHFSIPVFIVNGNSQNDKLTTPDDFKKFLATLEA
ncbi:2-C-methyl-D-erythritol 4-phosphate cytidylyltransferase [Hallerella porci]|uniref:2-C-methyl-D-erythritol 4-phosphate cytidylyltransferase n=2 Tax=Hallerella porci TaxID=1945871 RepID=A0ABX5LM59_9BACT|nr:2-C-methyl-D-erythritol 4-phosphate cytidylyltransferase [Hallerella porci]